MDYFFSSALDATTLTVGLNGEYHTLSAAVAASQAGDTIEVQAGTYVNDFPATITHSLTIEGVGGIAYLHATEAPPNEKAILLVGSSLTPSAINVVIKDMGFEGAQISGSLGGNAAGIKLQSGNLTVEDSYFAGNQMGILTGNYVSTSITVTDSVFAGQTGEVNGLSHQLYIGNIGSATIDHDLFLTNSNGHQIKSRAETTIVENTTIDDGMGHTSYDIDLPNGGTATLTGNTIVKGVNDPNTTVISFGEEGHLWAHNALTVSDNIIDNQLIGNRGIGVDNYTSAVADILDNQFYHLPRVAIGPNVQSGNIVLTNAPVVSDTSPITIIPASSGSTIEAYGVTALSESGNHYFMAPVAGGTDVELMYHGAPVTVGEWGAWAPIGAEATATGYEVALHNASTNQYLIWLMDSGGNYLSESSFFSGTSSTLENAETVLHQDLNGDGVIGVPGAVA